ncbi:glycosyltransferase [Tannerella sp. AM09-19]|nr:glycosyltransferase [Tannerella sp. AM09-19]
MEIAFILSYPRIVPTDGIVRQAYSWKKGLESRGHTVTLINMWEYNDWTKFNTILLFGFSEYMRDVVLSLSAINPNIVLAPILDPNYCLTILKCYTLWGSKKLRLTNHYHSLRQVKHLFKKFLVRSEFERTFLYKGFGIEKDKCKIVPLSYNVAPNAKKWEKEPFCLHISLLCDKRKNVKRLIDASVKYGFKLVLCGVLRSINEQNLLNSWIRDKKNICYMGYVSYEKMMELYTRARVFALPSTYEGVGIVALDAATMGCDIVITELGGPKEYYRGLAKVVNPYDVDAIGKAVLTFLNGETFQPQLSQYIKTTYSIERMSLLLEKELMLK